MNNECGWITLAGTSLGREALIKSEKADWLIVGAGITGLCAAHALAQMHPQARIVIVDRQRAAQALQPAIPVFLLRTKTRARRS